MYHSLIQFSTLAARLLQEDHPPAEAMADPFNFGLTPFGVVVVVLLAIAVVWLAMSLEAGRADLHATARHDEHEH